MKTVLLTILRNKNTSMPLFRETAQKLGYILASEASAELATKSLPVTTPFAKTAGLQLKNEIILVPILRSGLALLDPFLHIFTQASVGFIGLRRDEITAEPKEYYRNIPQITDNTFIFLLDPMIATGGSGIAALRILTDIGIAQHRITFVAVITSQPGIDAIKHQFPDIKIIFAGKDPKLNNKKFIVPGLGDFGDRYFGTI